MLTLCCTVLRTTSCDIFYFLSNWSHNNFSKSSFCGAGAFNWSLQRTPFCIVVHLGYCLTSFHGYCFIIGVAEYRHRTEISTSQVNTEIPSADIVRRGRRFSVHH